MDFQLDNVIEVLLSPDNQRRIEAEKFVDNIPLTHFDQGIEAFLLTMNHQNPQVASMAALLLKKKYLENEESVQKLSTERLEYILKNVQGCMNADRPIMFLNRCCDILVKVYNHAGQQKELINLIQALSAEESHNMKMALFYLIEVSCECSFDDNLHMQHAGSLEALFQRGLNDESNQVKVAAFKTLTIFLSSIEDEKLIKKFEGVLQLLISKAIELIKYDQESGVTAVESMNELIETHPKFIKCALPELLTIFTEIMEAQGLLINLRISSMYGVYMLCINHPASIRKSDYFKTNMVPAYMRMLSEIHGSTTEEWAEELNDEIISKNDISLSTEEHLGQLTAQLTNKFMLPLFIPHIQQYLSSQQVEHQHSGLVAMAILTEDCHESFKSELKNIMGLMNPLLGSSDPRIMHDMLMAMGYMSEEFAPELQQNYGEMMLQFIVKCLQYPALKVQFKAVQCIQNFEKGLAEHKEVKVMEGFLPLIMQELARIFEYSLNKTNYILMDGVLDTIITIADMNPFENYYAAFMPGLKRILSNMSAEDQQQIMARSKTVETMGYLLASIKDHPALFQPDCQEIMQTMVQLSLSLHADDPLHKAIFVVYENVVTSLKGGFLPYAELIFPVLMMAADRKIEFTILEEGDVSKKESMKGSKHNYAAYKLDMKVDGVKNLVLNTDNLAQKIEASNLLVQMAEDMGQEFARFIERTIPLVRELISYKHNKEIRNNMIETIKYMILDCANNDQKTFIVAETFQALTQELAITIRQRDHTEMACIVEAMAEMMPFMNAEMGAKLPEMLAAVLNLVRSETKEIEKDYADKDMDEAEQEEMDAEVEEVEEVTLCLFRAWNTWSPSSKPPTACPSSSNCARSSPQSTPSLDVVIIMYIPISYHARAIGGSTEMLYASLEPWL